jgi:hypothetical protein
MTANGRNPKKEMYFFIQLKGRMMVWWISEASLIRNLNAAEALLPLRD